MENVVIRHSKEINSLKRNTAKYSGVAANLIFNKGELPSPEKVTARLLYDIDRDILFRNAGLEWRGSIEHIVTYTVNNGRILMPNLTGCPIRILDFFTENEPTYIIINDTLEITKEALSLIIFEEILLEIKLGLPEGETVTIKYTEVG